MNTIKSVGLFYKDQKSDKEYHASINEVDGLCTVDFAYGRRGSALATGTKTSSPVDLPAAEKIYIKLVAEKEAKGYTRSGSGKAFTGTNNEERCTGLFPQLLNPIAESELERYFCDDEWVEQEKYDGKRILISVKGGVVTGSNRKGLTVSLPQELETGLFSVSDCIIDGELLGNKYIAFDLLETSKDSSIVNLRDHGYLSRYAALQILLADLEVQAYGIYVSDIGIGENQKRTLYAKIRHHNGEGIVFKNRNSSYVAGRPASGGTQVKFKFYATATVNVTEINNQRSVKISAGNNIAVGNVTIPPNKAIPNVGDIVEVRYLYAYPGGSLYQPTYIGVRDDIDRVDSLASLKFKSDSESEE